MIRVERVWGLMHSHELPGRPWNLETAVEMGHDLMEFLFEGLSVSSPYVFDIETRTSCHAIPYCNSEAARVVGRACRDIWGESVDDWKTCKRMIERGTK